VQGPVKRHSSGASCDAPFRDEHRIDPKSGFHF
jgi:hypothetical protein